MIRGATERWVTIKGVAQELLVNLFRTEQDFLKWNTETPREWTRHPTCEAVEEACFAKTQQKCRVYRLNRMEYVGHLVKVEK